MKRKTAAITIASGKSAKAWYFPETEIPSFWKNCLSVWKNCLSSQFFQTQNKTRYCMMHNVLIVCT